MMNTSMDKKKIREDILNTPYKLFPKQAEAVTSDKRFVRVIAGAGAGKTETLTRRISYLLLHEDCPPRATVAFTFTKRAAQSMKNRVYQRVAQLIGEDACTSLGEMYIGTIHSYCLQLLQDYFGYGNYEELDENQEMAFLMRHGWGMGLHQLGGAYSDNCASLLRSVSLVYDELIDRKALESEDSRFFHRLNKYEDLLRKHRLLTFAQMIFHAVDGLEKNRSPIAGIKHLIVDEYQDINRAQERLVELIGGTSSIFVVGDPRQCIYRWRGSDESYFQNFTKTHKDTHAVTIAENNRSSPEIVKAANNFAATFTSAKYEPLKEVRKEKGTVVLVACDTDTSEASWLINQVDILVNKRKICNYSDIAVLMRSVATSAEPFIDACKSKGIPFLVGGKVGLFRRDEAQMMGRLYAWLSDKGFWRLDRYTRQSITGDDLLFSAAELYEGTMRPKKFPFKSIEKWKDGCLDGDFRHFTDTYQSLLVTLGFHKLDPEDKVNAAIFANLGRFNALLTDFESSIRRGGDRIDWNKVWHGLVWFMNSYAIGAYEEQPTDDLRGVDVLQIMTVHQAKGLEWPIVFIPCMTSIRFPSSRAVSDSGQDWQVPTDLFDYKRYNGGYEDERKLFYVAITRAKDHSCLSYHKRIQRSISGSHFLSNLGDRIIIKKETEPLPEMAITKKVEQEEIQTYSGGEIIGYLRCPYFYRLREQWNYQAGLDVALGYGKSLHHCLRIASEAVKNGNEPEEAVSKAVEDEFHLPYANPKAKENMLESARKVLSSYVQRHREDMKNIEEVEARLEFPVQNATVTGRVDVILHDEKGTDLEVRDYKTSEEVTTFEESSLQVRIYTLGLCKLGRNVNRASIAYLDTGEVKQVDVSQKRLEEAQSVAERAIEHIAASRHTPAGKKTVNVTTSQFVTTQNSALGHALDYHCTKLTFVNLRLAKLNSGKCLDITRQAKYDGYTIGICPRFALRKREFMTKTIVMIHGMWGGSWYWENYKRFFEGKGYQCITPTLRFHDMDPRGLPNPQLGTTSLLDYLEDLEEEIHQLDALPILMGHSMGGLLAQMLGSRGLAKALILLTPASPRGIIALTPSVVRSFWSGLTKWGFWRKPMRQTFNEAVYSMLQLLPAEEQKKIFGRFVYESGRAACEIGFWFLDRKGAARVDEAKVTCPVLVVAGGQDRITPASVVRRVAAKYRAVSTYKEFPDHAHWVVGEPRWQEVAEYVSDWLHETVGPDS